MDLLSGNGIIVQRYLIKVKMPAVRFFQKIDAAQQRGLSAAAGTSNDNHVPFVNSEVYSFQHFMLIKFFVNPGNL
jgi:hypothetical protein